MYVKTFINQDKQQPSSSPLPSNASYFQSLTSIVRLSLSLRTSARHVSTATMGHLHDAIISKDRCFDVKSRRGPSG